MRFAYAPESTPLSGYKIKRAIDRGGFGEVYYGIADSGKEVALKLLQRNQQIELRGVRQCLNLKHPNLVALYDIRTDDQGDDWVIMEYVSGASLDGVLSEAPDGLPLTEVEQWLGGIAEGVAFLHDRGIVHRDLKPGNVFREHGIVKVGDVGLSKFITPSRRSAQTESVGTVYYMAPEVARGKYGYELDVYSLGVMTYEMICGRLPFDGESVAEILMKHLTEHPDLSRLPAPLRPVLARALEKDPQRRTAGVLQLSREFRAALRGETAAVEIPSTHFVDVERLESRQAREWQATSVAGRSEPSSPVQTAGTATEPRHGEPDALVPSGLWGHLVHELKINPVLIVALGITGLFLFPVLAYGTVGIRGALLSSTAFLTWIAIGSGAFWIARQHRVRSSLSGRPRPPLPPRRSGLKVPGRPIPTNTGVRQAEPDVRRGPVQVPVIVKPVRQSAESRRESRRVFTPDTPRRLSWRKRAGELLASLALVVFWSIVLATVIALFQRYVADVPLAERIVSDPAQAAVFTLATILGAWAVLVPSKLSEGRGRDSQTRWLLGIPLALGVGLATWWLQDSLLVRLQPDSVFPGILTRLGRWKLVQPDGTIPAGAFVAYFGLLLGAHSWWRQADGFRKHRLSVWTIVGSASIAWFLPILFRFNQPWGICWGAAISTVVQLASPWTPPADRPGLVDAAQQQTLAV